MATNRGVVYMGPGKVEWYDEALERTMLRRMMLEQDLPGALVRGE